MTRTRIVLFLAAIVVLSAVVPAEHTDTLPLGPKERGLVLRTVEAGQILDTRTGKAVTLDAIVRRAADADAVVVGEYHDSMACHRFQAELVRGMGRRYPRTVVGFEFFRRGDDPALAAWSRGEKDETGLLRAVAWYNGTSMPFAYTRVVMRAIREKGLPAIGLNVPRSLVHRVAAGGLDALNTQERRLFELSGTKNPEHRYFIQQVFGAAALRLPPWFERIYTAQTCWDAVMAASMRQFLDSREGRGHKGIIIAGAAHVAYGLGIPFRYRLGKRRARLLTIVPVRVAAGERELEGHPMLRMMAANMPAVGMFSAGIADYVLGLPAKEENIPALDVSGHMEKDVFVVDKVGQGGLPAQLGLRKGDRVLSVDGDGVSSQAELRLLLGMERQSPPRIRLERTLGEPPTADQPGAGDD